MTTEKMTVHKALAELKIIDDRIQKAIENSTFITVRKKVDTKIDGMPVNDFEQRMKSDYQKVSDLINRRNAMKRAVVLSNAITEIEVAGNKYTVAEAIDMKNHGMDNMRKFLQEMTYHYMDVMRRVDMNSGEHMEDKANQFVRQMLASQGTSTESASAAQIQELHDSFVKNNEVEIVDPNDISHKMEEIDTFIDDFNTELDAALSVSNALTTIEFEY